MPEKNEIVIYTTPEGKETFEVNLKKDTVWLSQKQMAELFEKNTDTIGLHIKNIFSTEELDNKSTTEEYSVVQMEGGREVKRKIKFYNLDLIISVGYRVNSKRGTKFRIWATNVLKDHLIKGYTINEKRIREDRAKLKEFQKTSRIMERLLQNKALDSTEATGLLKVILDYQKALHLLDEYDFQKLEIKKVTTQEKFKISYQRARQELDRLKAHYPSTLFGLEKDQSFSGSIGAIYQSFDGKDLYPSIEEKAAHLLYFVVKNHSFIDGNKRIAASLFLWFLNENGILYNEDGSKRLADNALVALTLLIAESRAEEKDTMAKVVVNLINQNNWKVIESKFDNFFIVTFTRTKNVPENVPEIQRIIIVEMKKNNKITYDELAKIIDKNRKTILRHISVLKERGIIRRIGPAKGGYWKVVEK